jgi:holliday junction DNA helicase RuvA
VIALIRGTVAAAGLGQVVVDCGGVGYRVLVPPATAVPKAGEEVTLHTHLAVREDALTLYGFTDPASRGLFETLLAVSGVGPKLALAAIGTLGADGLRRAVVGGDVAALTVVPGVGKKSAQRMVLELREKLGAPGSDDIPGEPATVHSARDEVRQALVALGYAPAEAAKSLEALPDDGTPEELLRTALKSLGGGGTP